MIGLTDLFDRGGPVLYILFLVTLFIWFIIFSKYLATTYNNKNWIKNNFKKPKQIKQTDAISLNSKDEILNYLSVSDKSFTQQSFIEGSKKAYEMIVQNYAMGNLSSIKDFISGSKTLSYFFHADTDFLFIGSLTCSLLAVCTSLLVL